MLKSQSAMMCLLVLSVYGCDETPPEVDAGVADGDSGTTSADGGRDPADLDAGPDEGDAGSAPDGLVLIGTSGDQIVLNQLWIQGCVPGAGGATWTDSRRVLLTDSEPYRLVTTLTDYQNGSATPDCENARVGVTTFTQEVASLGTRVPFTWVDAMGVDDDAPPGLEGITEANGMEGIMTVASVTPETTARADQLNSAMFCGISDWAAGEVRDTLLCFSGGVPPVSGKTILVVDDSEIPWRNYQASPESPLSAEGYPTQMPNIGPFEGPFAP